MAEAQDARLEFQAFLDSIGLGHMSDLITKAVAEPTMTPTKFALQVENDPRFLDAFPEIKRIREKKDTGLMHIKAGDVLAYRETVKTLFANAGVPKGFYDQPEDFVDLMVDKRISPVELGERIDKGFLKVDQAPQEVKDVFNSFFGAQGNAALVTMFLDPAKGTKVLGEMVAQAEIGGAGKMFGFGIDLARAERLREAGITDLQRATQGFQQAGELRPLEQETISEAADITEEELVEGAFGLTEAGLKERRKLERRGQERQAAFGGSGGVSQRQTGFGVGTAR